MNKATIKFKQLPGLYTFCKFTELDRETRQELFVRDLNFLCLTQNASELSLVCDSTFAAELEGSCAGIVKTETDFCCFKIQGALEFSMLGIIANITQILAQNKISVCLVSSFDTDYFLVKKNMLDSAKSSLEQATYVFV